MRLGAFALFVGVVCFAALQHTSADEQTPAEGELS